MKKTLDDLEDERAAKEAELKALNDQIKDKKRQTLVQCENTCQGKGCGMAMRIGDLEYIQTYWYEGPYGCMGGDTWHAGEGNFRCLHCGHINRLNNRPDIEKLKPLFKSIKNVHER